ncbi:TetR/AcrR family transcriptional regulator [Nocardia sp. NBC_01388]|uniref:TetR/AcrR family transcriptional regulator n=1 Tax=Nocardia sp. NBC_01388 TaxID=2903596 RepID=UPI003250A575
MAERVQVRHIGEFVAAGKEPVRSERRRQILVAANEVFTRNGYRGTSMNEVAARAFVSKPVLYRYFPGKVDLYLVVLQHHVDALVSAVSRALCSTSDNHERVRAAVHAYFDFVDQESQGYRLVFNSDPAIDPRVSRHAKRASDACTDAVYDLLAQESGLDSHRARFLAVGVVGASRMIARYWLNSPGGVSKADAIDTTVELCWGGLSQLRPSKAS